MSSGSCENHVQESAISDTSYNEEQKKIVLNILSHYQVIYDVIQNLDKKLDMMHGKVSKIHCFRMKTMWQNRKPRRYVYKNYYYLLSRKIRFQKMRKKEPPSTFAYPESYSSTLPVERQENRNDVQRNPQKHLFSRMCPLNQSSCSTLGRRRRRSLGRVHRFPPLLRVPFSHNSHQTTNAWSLYNDLLLQPRCSQHQQCFLFCWSFPHSGFNSDGSWRMQSIK